MRKSTIQKLIILLTLLIVLPIKTLIAEGVILKTKISGMNAEKLLPSNAEYIGNGLFVLKEDKRFAAQNKGSHPCEQYIDEIKQGIFDCEADIKLHIGNTPNDSKVNSLWGMRKIGALQAWEVETGSDEVVIGVIDSGIDYNHPDLAANMWVNPNEIAGNGIDDDGNGVVDDIFGYNAITNSGNPMDDNSHGTHCAGTIGGVGNNGIGVSGVSWNVKMIAAKFIGPGKFGLLSNAIKSIDYLTNLKTNHGVNIILTNNSWGGSGYSQFLRDSIDRHRQAGIIFVAAAGNLENDNDSISFYPANYDLNNIISVAATDMDDNLADFSNYGATKVDIGAPGVGILSTIHINRYASYSGTSMATPHVAGAIALLKSHSNLSMSELINRVYDTGDSLNQLNGIVRTGKRLNVNNMLRNNVTTPPTPPNNGGKECKYTATKLNSFIGLNPSQITSLPLIAEEKDEFYEPIPVSMEFFDEKIDKVFASPNGVIYFTPTARTEMDFTINSGVRSKSISVFHSDLISNIYAGKDSKGRSVIGFRSVPYSNKSEDYTYSSLIHIGNGSFIASFTKPSSADFGNVLMGIKGETAASEVLHYKGVSSTLDNSYSIKYTLSCSGDDEEDEKTPYKDSTITNLRAKYNIKGKSLKKNKIRKRALFAKIISTHSKNSGIVNEKALIKIGNTTCSETINLNLRSNKTKSAFFTTRFRNIDVNLTLENNPEISLIVKAKNRRRTRRLNYQRNSKGIEINSNKKCTRFIRLFNKYNK